MSYHGPRAESPHRGGIYSGAFHHLFVGISMLIQSSHHSPSASENQTPRMTDHNISKVDRDPSLERENQMFALASIVALFIHSSWPSGPFSYSDKFDWIWLLWKVPRVLTTLYPIWMLLLIGEIELRDLFSYSGYYTSGLKIKRLSTDQEREDRNFMANLIIAVISALVVTVDGANLFLDLLNAIFPTIELDLLCNFVVSVYIFLFLLLAFFSWIPMLNLLSMRKDVPSAPKLQRLFDARTKDENSTVTDLIATVEKYERSLSRIGSRQAIVQEFLTKLRSERDSDTPTSG